MAELEEDAKLEVVRTVDATTPVLRLTGEIDLSTTSLLRGAITDAAAESADIVALDLTEVTFMDSTGVGLFLELTGRGVTLELRSPSLNVRRVIETTGLTERLPMVP